MENMFGLPLFLIHYFNLLILPYKFHNKKLIFFVRLDQIQNRTEKL